MLKRLVPSKENSRRSLHALLVALSCLASVFVYAGSPEMAAKERLVLMPLRVPEEDRSLLGAMETALVQGMQQRYEVLSGEPVATKAREIFNAESRASSNKECDETRCMQDIAQAFAAELIASANVTRKEDGYFLALRIQNVFDTRVVYSSAIPCQNCNSYQVLEELKALSGATMLVSAVTAEPAMIIPAVSRIPADADATLWAEAQKADTIVDYQIYQDSFPNGRYLHYAQTRIRQLQQQAVLAAEQQQQQDWDSAQQEHSAASYDRYLNRYPDGRFAAFAKARIDKLNNQLAAREEAELWNKAYSSNGKAAIQGYLRRYPAGHYLAAAHAKLKLIQEEEERGPLMVRIPERNYEIGKYEVTQAEWRAVMGNNPSEFKRCGDSCPVERVSWDEVQKFIRKLNARSGRQYRLPTQAEWEYACHGGSPQEYCGGDEVNALAWTAANSFKQTVAVGQKQANGYGLYDMSGNVWEWTSDCWRENCAQRVLRGGSWSEVPQYARAAFSYPSDTLYLNEDVGFRLARSLP